MSRKKWKSVLASCAVVGAVALAGGGCSGGNGTTNDGGGDDAADEIFHPAPRGDTGAGNPETGTMADSSSRVDSSTGFDRTIGKPCTTDADCSLDPTNPTTNKCTLANSGGPGFFTAGPVYPTPVCVNAGCNAGTDNFIHYCDGPDVSTSPGVCLPTAGGNTLCLPQCSIPSNASAPTGCQGMDRCNVFGSGLRNGQPFAVGFCFGGCAADGDCPTGSVCQKDDGVCVTAPVTRAKQLGQTCSVSDPTGTCNCLSNATTGVGYCTQFCIVGPLSPAPCPSGYVCDAGLPATITSSATDASVPGFTSQNVGLAGSCLQICGTGGGDAGGGPSDDASLEAGADASGDASAEATSDATADASGDASTVASDAGTEAAAPSAGASCPATSTCSSRHAVGSACLP